eukprot:1800431-Pleurochrysis_carterae.AAC.4
MRNSSGERSPRGKEACRRPQIMHASRMRCNAQWRCALERSRVALASARTGEGEVEDAQLAYRRAGEVDVDEDGRAN